MTRQEYLEIVNAYIDAQKEIIAAIPSLESLNLKDNTFHKEELGVIDQSKILECDDDWGLPLMYGWIAIDEHFTGELDQDYYLDNIIEVSYGD